MESHGLRKFSELLRLRPNEMHDRNLKRFFHFVRKLHLRNLFLHFLHVAMHIQISQSTRALLIQRGEYLIRSRGEMQVKGKGLMHTHWLVGKLRLCDFSKYLKDEDCEQTTTTQ